MSEDLRNQFPEEQREVVKKIWEQSGHIRQEEAGVTDEETEESLRTVHRKLGFEGRRRETDQRENTGRGEAGKRENPDSKWLWLAAAAVLIIIGIGWLATPKSHTVPYGETATVVLPDGSVVEMNSGTSLQHSRFLFDGNRAVRLDGEAFFDVESGESPFVVQANGASITVTGTRFNVRSWSDDPDSVTTVTVSEGGVLLSPVKSPAQSITLSGGESSVWSPAMDKPSDPQTVSLENFPLWRSNIFQFNNEAVTAIFRELERRFNVSIEIEESVVRTGTLSAYYINPEDVESVISDISTVKGLRYSETADGYRVYR